MWFKYGNRGLLKGQWQPDFVCSRKIEDLDVTRYVFFRNLYGRFIIIQLDFRCRE